MKPDILISWPQHLDYPLWRKFIHDNRTRFGKVIIVFTNMNAGGDYRQFVQDAMAKDNVTTVDNDPVAGDQDWRNVAVNKGLKYSESAWVWFTEQDFIIHTPEEFWQGVSDCEQQDAQVICYLQGERMHPCCLFIQRFVLNNFTSKDFGVVPDVSDHFSKLSAELLASPTDVYIRKIAEKGRPSIFEHLNGLSQNIFMLQHGEQPNYDVPRFKKYCKDCLEAGVTMPDDMRKLFERYTNENNN